MVHVVFAEVKRSKRRRIWLSDISGHSERGRAMGVSTGSRSSPSMLASSDLDDEVGPEERILPSLVRAPRAIAFRIRHHARVADHDVGGLMGVAEGPNIRR